MDNKTQRALYKVVFFFDAKNSPKQTLSGVVSDIDTVFQLETCYKKKYPNLRMEFYGAIQKGVQP